MMENNMLKQEVTKGLKVTKIFNTPSTETLLISLSKDKTFPKHTSPKEALLVMIEGSIIFFINDEQISLHKHDTYTFGKEIEHYVIATSDAKFLIIR